MRRSTPFLLFAFLLGGSISASSSVVINEIMYNSPGTPDVEYVELLNAGPQSHDLSGWYLLDDDDSHDRCYLFGVLGPGEYRVVAGRLDLFTARYPGVQNVNPAGFDSAQTGVGFGLGNTTDRVRLFDANGQLVDSVEYADLPPWPVEADGQGPSLELIHPALDNALASSWGASMTGPPEGTPGTLNSIAQVDPPPTVVGVQRDVALPRSDDVVAIFAEVADDQALPSVDLHVDTGTGFAVTAMRDDGLGGDELAGDGVFSATIAPEPAGTLVRYYVVAVDTLGQIATEPPSAPTDYLAYTVDHRPPPARINEILASNQAGLSDGAGDRDDWLELRNPGPDPIALEGLFLSDSATEPRKWPLPDVVLEPGEYALFWCDDETFEGPFHTNFRLARTGGEVWLFDSVDHGNTSIHGFTFGPQSADVSFGFLPEDSDAPEYIATPTPQADNSSAELFSTVCINEFLTASQIPGAPDWIELYNRGTITVNISGWSLSDDPALPRKYVFPAATALAPGGYLTVDDNALGFGLNGDGSDVIVLTHADGETGQDYFDYGPQLDDVSQGRWPDGSADWHFLSPSSRGLANRCDPGIAPLPPVERLRFESRFAIAWDPLDRAEVYDLLTGSLAALRAGAGDFAGALESCSENNGTDTRGWDPGAPPGGGRFLLVRGANRSCRFGTYASAGADGVDRDASIASSPTTCP